jgi:hypothetical protein
MWWVAKGDVVSNLKILMRVQIDETGPRKNGRRGEREYSLGIAQKSRGVGHPVEGF